MIDTENLQVTFVQQRFSFKFLDNKKINSFTSRIINSLFSINQNNFVNTNLNDLKMFPVGLQSIVMS